jgi:hypothetical protein
MKTNTLYQIEWISVSTALTTQGMLKYLPSTWHSTISHTLQEEQTFIVRYVVVS